MNIFDTLESVSSVVPDLRDELKRYLATDVEPVSDAIQWWYDRHATFPNLSQMALDYLTIPGSSPSPFPIPCTSVTHSLNPRSHFR